MRVRAVALVALLLASWPLVACGQQGETYLFEECPTVSAEDQAQMEKMLGGPVDDRRYAGDSTAAYFTVICR